jgi:tripeptidyl-peptidase-1
MNVLVPCLLLLRSLGAVSRVLHMAPTLPSTWQRVSRLVHDDHQLVLTISLRQTRLAELYETVRRVSNPKSPTYGQYLTRAEVDQLTAPAPSSIDTVERWLNEAAVRFSRRGELIEATLTAKVAAKLLQTRFHHVACKWAAPQTVADDYSLPVEVHDAVLAIYGLHGLPLPPRPFISISNSVLRQMSRPR